MNTKLKSLVHTWAVAGAVLSLSGVSMVAEAGSWWFGDSPSPVNAICQSDESAGGQTYQDCGNGAIDGAIPSQPLVPKSHRRNTCFFLTDFTAYNNNPINNGGRRVDLRDGDMNRSTIPAKLVYFLAYNSPQSGPNGGTTTTQDFETPVVFWNDLYADVYQPNSNVFVAVSGYYDRCPK